MANGFIPLPTGFDVVRVSYMTYAEIREIGDQPSVIYNKTTLPSFEKAQAMIDLIPDPSGSVFRYAIFPAEISRGRFQ